MDKEMDSSVLHGIPDDAELEGITRDIDYLKLAEVGYSGLNRWGHNVSEEFIPQLVWPQAGKIYKEMADNDPVIGAILYMSKQLVKNAEWIVKPHSDSAADKEAAQFLRECMDDMSHTWASTICEVLSMITYGWSFLEVVYKIRGGPDNPDPKKRSEYSDGRIGWRKMPARSQLALYGWTFSESDGEVNGIIIQGAPDYKLVTIPLSKGLLFRTEEVLNNPEGRSMLRNAYRPWYFKKKIEEIEGIGIERDLAGLPVIHPPEGVDIYDTQNPESVRQRQYAEAMVKNIRRDAAEGVVLPFGWDLKLMSTGGARQFDTNAIINRYDQRIAITMLSDIVMLGADKVGSFALASVKESLLAASLEAIVNMIADVFNKYAVTQLFKYNYFPGITGIPKLVPGEIETPDLEELGNFFRNTGMKLEDDYELMNYMRRIASLPGVSEEQFAEIKAARDALRSQTAAATAGRESAAETAQAQGQNASPKARAIQLEEDLDLVNTD